MVQKVESEKLDNKAQGDCGGGGGIEYHFDRAYIKDTDIFKTQRCLVNMSSDGEKVKLQWKKKKSSRARGSERMSLSLMPKSATHDAH